MHDHLIAIAARPSRPPRARAAGEERVRDSDEGVRAGTSATAARRSRGNVLFVPAMRSRGNVHAAVATRSRGNVLPREPVLRGLERRHQERALLRGQTAADEDTAIVGVIERDPSLGRLSGGGALGGHDAAIGAQQALQLRSRRVAGQVEQILLALDVLHARERAHLRVAQLTLGERCPDQRQLAEAPRDAHVLARSPGSDPALPRHPMRT